MRVYKSPVQLKGNTMQKKSSINFVKNIASPKIKSQHIYNNQNNHNTLLTYQTYSNNNLGNNNKNLHNLNNNINGSSSSSISYNKGYTNMEKYHSSNTNNNNNIKYENSNNNNNSEQILRIIIKNESNINLTNNNHTNNSNIYSSSSSKQIKSSIISTNSKDINNINNTNKNINNINNLNKSINNVNNVNKSINKNKSVSKNIQKVNTNIDKLQQCIQQQNKDKEQIIIYYKYNSNTQIKNLLSYIHLQLQNNLIYIKSQNIYIDYILNLKSFKLKSLIQLINQSNQHTNNNHKQLNNHIQIHNHNHTSKFYNINNSNKNNHNNNKNNNINNKNILQITICQYHSIDNNNYLNNFQIIKCVGSGGFSKVFLVRAYGKLFAMKVINKQYILQNDKSNIINNQKTILTICSQHPFITKLQTSFETPNYLIFVMEFCNGGQLFNLLRKVRRMKQQDAKFYFIQTLSAIVYLHKKGIVYRDIKPENIIIDHQGHIRLADYGLSKIMQDTRQSKTYSFCGSAQYMAPQMLLKKGHSYEIDFYCLGALLYELVVGLPPYYSRNQNELFSNIINNELQFPSHVMLSQQLKSFLSNLLQKQVQNRYKTIQQIMNDRWMSDVDLQLVLDKRLKPPYNTDMLGYNFDDSDFIEQQQQMIRKLQQQKKVDIFEDIRFEQIIDLKCIINKSKQSNSMFIRSNNLGQFITIDKSLSTTSNRYQQHNHQINNIYHHHHNNYQFTNHNHIINNNNNNISNNNNVRQQITNYKKSRNVTNNGSVIMMTKHSRQPSINRLDHSNIITLPTSSQISKRINDSNIFNQSNHQINTHNNNGIYYQTNNNITGVNNINNINNISHSNNKPHLTTVRSLQHINTSKQSLIINNRSQQRIISQQRINSINKSPQPYNIYTTHKQPFHPFGIKLSNPTSSLISSNQHVRQPNYYSVQKSSSRGDGIRLDIHDLKIKNSRNYSMQRVRQNYSINNKSHSIVNNNNRNNISSNNINNYQNLNNSNNLNQSNSNNVNKINNNNVGYLKHTMSAYELKKSYIDTLKQKNSFNNINNNINNSNNNNTNKVKKSSFKNGQKISITMLNNLHYRN